IHRLIMRHRFVNAILILNTIPHITVKPDTTKDDDDAYYKFLGDALDKDTEIRRAEHKHHFEHVAKVVPKPFKLPDYCPLIVHVRTFQHLGGDVNVPIPWWGFLDIGGHFIERFQDYWAKVGYSNSPINMLGLRKDQIVRILSDPSLHYNRQNCGIMKDVGNPFLILISCLISENQPNLPVAVLPKNYASQSCKPPMCNPYHSSIGFGAEANVHIEDGYEGEIDLPVPIGKGIGYRLPISGNYHRDTDDISVTYGQNLHPIDPLIFAPDRDLFVTKRRRRSADYSLVSSGILTHLYPK
ncbi:hypothetical protein GCK32_015285, partial [Trichostrongylus colubriformis]